MTGTEVDEDGGMFDTSDDEIKTSADEYFGNNDHMDIVEDEVEVIENVDTEEDDNNGEVNKDTHGDDHNEDATVDDPEVGMEFETTYELYDWWIKFGNAKGFPMKRRSSRKGDDRVMRWVVFACSRSGKVESTSRNPLKMHPTTKTDCDVKLRAALGTNNKWYVTSFSLEHNHILSPVKSRYYKKNRVMNSFVKRRLEINDRAGIRPNKNFNSFVMEAGGPENLSFLEKDCRNYIGKVRELRLGEGDAAAVQNYFKVMQANNSNFYSLLDLDQHGRIRNIFWVDARSRAAYEEFGDALTFDTTYLTNKYEMPFAPFVGVNHHGQSTLMGCALLSNEDTETFTWIFQTFLECMGDRAPLAIVTDQDKAMQNAIAVVFPNARHIWCLLHIMKKIPEKLKSYKMYKAIKLTMKTAVYNSLTTEEFDERWTRFIKEFELENNTWLTRLYKEKHRWVPAFVKDKFWARMSATQRSESMHAFFDGYVNSKTTLKQFLEQYENALRSKVEKERQEDFNCFNSKVPCITPLKMENQIQSVYTIAKFKEFQSEVIGKITCEGRLILEDGRTQVYHVLETMVAGFDREEIFTVRLNIDDSDMTCTCRLFDFKGIVCRHCVVVLLQNLIDMIPKKCILWRWRKDVKRSHTKVKVIYSNWMLNPENERFDRMCNAFYETADFATSDEDKTRLVMDWIQRLRDELRVEECVNSQSTPFLRIKHHIASSSDNTENVGTIHSPLRVHSKGRPPFKRKQNTTEKVVKRLTQKEKAKEKEREKTSEGKRKEKTKEISTRKLHKERNNITKTMEFGQTQESITLPVETRDLDSHSRILVTSSTQPRQEPFGNHPIHCPQIQGFNNGLHAPNIMGISPRIPSTIANSLNNPHHEQGCTSHLLQSNVATGVDEDRRLQKNYPVRGQPKTPSMTQDTSSLDTRDDYEQDEARFSYLELLRDQNDRF